MAAALLVVVTIGNAKRRIVVIAAAIAAAGTGTAIAVITVIAAIAAGIIAAVVGAIAYYRPVRLALVPKSIKNERAHKRAVEQFLAQNLYTTKSHTGVLIFISSAERYAEIIADKNIYIKVPQERWQALVDRLTLRIGEGDPADGLVETITETGALMATHFPPGNSNPDELPNHLIVID